MNKEFIFIKTMTWLEKYIEKSNYYSDWEERKQIHVITGSGINEANELAIKVLNISVIEALNKTISGYFYGTQLEGTLFHSKLQRIASLLGMKK